MLSENLRSCVHAVEKSIWMRVEKRSLALASGKPWETFDQGVESKLQWLDSVARKEVEGASIDHEFKELAAKAKFIIQLFFFSH